MNPLERKIRDYYESQKLPKAALEAIRAEGLRQRELDRGTGRGLWKVVLPLAAGAAILILVLVVGQAFQDESVQRQRHLVATEMARSHCKHLDRSFAYAVEDFGQLQTTMNQLDFSLLPVEKQIRDRFVLTGARYCSVSGHVACHFSVYDKHSGQHGSLYVAMLDPALRRVSPGQCESNAVVMEMWNDGARFYCFAHGGRALPDV